MIINDLFNNKKQDVAEGQFQDEHPEYGGGDPNKTMTYDRNIGMGYAGDTWSDAADNWSGDQPNFITKSTYEPDPVVFSFPDGSTKEFAPNDPFVKQYRDKKYGIPSKVDQITKAFTQAEKNNPNAQKQPVVPISPTAPSSSSSSAPSTAKPKPGSWQELAQLNKITDPRKLQAGTRINTPDGGSIYVNKGDTLSGIAQKIRRQGMAEDDGFNVVSNYQTQQSKDTGDKVGQTYTSTTIQKNPATGQQKSLAKFDYTDPATGKNYSGSNYIDAEGNVETQKNYDESKNKVNEVSLGDYRKKAALDKALAQTDRFFGRDNPAKVAAADQTIAKRERGLARADARTKPYTPPPVDQDKQRRDLADKYPNIDELVAQAEKNRDPYYDRAEGEAYYRGRDAEHNYHKLKQIQRMIRGAELDEMNFGGVSQTTDSDTGDITTSFNQGPMSVSQTKTLGGYTKQTDQRFDLGPASVAQKTVGPNIGAGQLAGTTTRTATNNMTGQSQQQVRGVGFGGASGANVGKNFVGASDDELAQHAAGVFKENVDRIKHLAGMKPVR